MLSYGKIARVLLIAAAPVMAQTPAKVPAPAVPQPRVATGTPTPAPNVYAVPARQPQSQTGLNPSVGNPAAIQAQTAAGAQIVGNPLSAAVPRPLPVGLATTPTASIAHNGTTAVNYIQGRLTILAENAPLGSVLKQVAAKTGANVDLAPELQSEPVIASLGPGSVQEVLTRLLDSPRIDYIIMGSGDEPGGLQRVIVRQRRSFGAMQAPQPKPEQELDENGHLASNGLAPEDAHLPQAELMDKWRREREEKRVAEIEEQRLAREAEKTNPDPPPPPPQDNPPAAPEPPPQNPQ